MWSMIQAYSRESYMRTPYNDRILKVSRSGGKGLSCILNPVLTGNKARKSWNIQNPEGVEDSRMYDYLIEAPFKNTRSISYGSLIEAPFKNTRSISYGSH